MRSDHQERWLWPFHVGNILHVRGVVKEGNLLPRPNQCYLLTYQWDNLSSTNYLLVQCSIFHQAWSAHFTFTGETYYTL